MLGIGWGLAYSFFFCIFWPQSGQGPIILDILYEFSFGRYTLIVAEYDALLPAAGFFMSSKQRVLNLINPVLLSLPCPVSDFLALT